MNESKGHFERSEAVRNHEKAWDEVLKAEAEDHAFRQRKRRLVMVSGLILTAAAMIAFIQFGKISYDLALCFETVIAAAFGWGMK